MVRESACETSRNTVAVRTDDDAFGEQFGLDDAFPEKEGILEAVDAAVLGKEFVKTGDGRKEENGVGVVKVRVPCGTLRERKSDDSQRTGYRPVGLGGGVG